MNKKQYAVFGYNDICIITAKTVDKTITKMIELGGKDAINLSTKQSYNKAMNKIFKEANQMNILKSSILDSAYELAYSSGSLIGLDEFIEELSEYYDIEQDENGITVDDYSEKVYIQYNHLEKAIEMGYLQRQEDDLDEN